MTHQFFRQWLDEHDRLSDRIIEHLQNGDDDQVDSVREEFTAHVDDLIQYLRDQVAEPDLPTAPTPDVVDEPDPPTAPTPDVVDEPGGDARTVASELKKLDPRRANLLRDFYYRVADALPQLAEELEFADLDLGGDGGPLLSQHLVVCEMLDAFRRLELGKHL